MVWGECERKRGGVATRCKRRRNVRWIDERGDTQTSKALQGDWKRHPERDGRVSRVGRGMDEAKLSINCVTVERLREGTKDSGRP